MPLIEPVPESERPNIPRFVNREGRVEEAPALVCWRLDQREATVLDWNRTHRHLVRGDDGVWREVGDGR